MSESIAIETNALSRNFGSVHAVAGLNMRVPAGQIYVATDLVNGDYYWAPTFAPTLDQAERAVVKGQIAYYRIYFNHRFGFVKASDVAVISVPQEPVRRSPHSAP